MSFARTAAPQNNNQLNTTNIASPTANICTTFTPVRVIFLLQFLLINCCFAMSNPMPHEVAKLVPAKGNLNGNSMEAYKKEYDQSIADPDTFWSNKAKELLDWTTPFTKVCHGCFKRGDIAWFVGGKLNLCYNAIDRHVLAGKGDQVGMLWEGDEPDDIRRITYQEMLNKVSQITNALKSQGVKKGDVVTIYMPSKCILLVLLLLPVFSVDLLMANISRPRILLDGFRVIINAHKSIIYIMNIHTVLTVPLFAPQ